MDLVQLVVPRLDAGRDHEPLVVTGEVCEEVGVQKSLVTGRRRERRHLAGMGGHGPTLRGACLGREGERPERRHPRIVGGGPVPEPHRELPVLGLATTGRGGRGPAHSLVVGVTVLGPRGGEHRVSAVADQVHERSGHGGDLVGEGTVGQPEPGERACGDAQPGGRLGVLLGPPGREHLGGMSRRPLVAAVAVARADEVDVDPGSGRRGDEPTGSEGLVVGVRGDDDEPAYGVQGRRFATRHGQPRGPDLRLGARARGREVVGKAAHHQRQPGSSPSTCAPCRERSRSAWCWRR